MVVVMKDNKANISLALLLWTVLFVLLKGRIVTAFAISSPSSSSSLSTLKRASLLYTKKHDKDNDNDNDNNNDVVMLQSQHPIYTPAEKFEQMVQDCQKYSISEWDVYGDFHKQPQVSSTSSSSEVEEQKEDQSSSTTLPQSSTSFLRTFEKEIANECGKEDGVFMPSGTMAQSIALLIHSNSSSAANKRKKNGNGNNNKSSSSSSFICHPTSHLLLHEQDGYRELCQLDAIPLPQNNNNNNIGLGLGASPLLYQHIQDYYDLDTNTNKNDIDDISTIILEVPHRELGGKITPFDDIVQIRQFCTTHQIAFHCDGARIFEATTGYDNNNNNNDTQVILQDLVEPFDSIYISFYKGLGGLSGAMLVGSNEFCQEARIWLRRFGGNIYTLLPYAISAYSGYQRYWKIANDANNNDKANSIDIDDDQSNIIMTFQQKKEKLVQIVKELSSSNSNNRNNNNGHGQEDIPLLLFEPSIPQVNMVHCYLQPTKEKCEQIRDQIIDEYGVSLFHRLRSIPKNNDENDDANDNNNDNDNNSNNDLVHVGAPAYQKGYRCQFELSMGEANGNIPTHIWIQAWQAFFQKATTNNL